MMLTYSFLMLIVYVKPLSLHNEISRVSLFVLHFHIVYSFKDLALHINIQHRGCNPLLHLQMVPMYEVVFLYFFLGFITLQAINRPTTAYVALATCNQSSVITFGLSTSWVPRHRSLMILLTLARPAMVLPLKIFDRPDSFSPSPAIAARGSKVNVYIE